MGIPELVKHVVVVDDACPNGSGKLLESQVTDPRVSAICNPTNLGVGGAVIRGYQHLLAEIDAQVVVKVQFVLSGREIAWIRAVDELDPKLSFAGGSAYLVRTVKLSSGKNRFEIVVEGERVWRATYAPRA
jgi:hypothetical protein